MRKTNLLFGLLFLALGGADAQTFRGLDKSPMDMAYYPDDYAHDRKFAPAKIGSDKAMVRVTYSRPVKMGGRFSVNWFLTAKYGGPEPMKPQKLGFTRT